MASIDALFHDFTEKKVNVNEKKRISKTGVNGNEREWNEDGGARNETIDATAKVNFY